MTLKLGILPPLAREAAPPHLAHAHGLLQLGRRELLRLLRRTRSAGCGAGGVRGSLAAGATGSGAAPARAAGGSQFVQMHSAACATGDPWAQGGGGMGGGGMGGGGIGRMRKHGSGAAGERRQPGVSADLLQLDAHAVEDVALLGLGWAIRRSPRGGVAPF